MKSFRLNTMLPALLAIIAVTAVSGCQKDDDPRAETSYDLHVQNVLGVAGTATFIETKNNSTTIDIVLFGAPSGVHPAELRMNSAVEGGAVVVNLNPVDATGKSSTLVPSMSYSQLIDFDGFIQVLKSSSEPDILLVKGDIGGNVLTDVNVSYSLSNLGTFGVSGNALFEKRKNGNTLVTLDLDGTIAGEVYPATINLSSVATIGGGPVTKTLSSVNGTTGKSHTNIRNLDGGMDITYDNWLVYNGYINIYQTAAVFDNIISQGNMGSNAD
jgi:hypothetical protein